MTKEKYKEVSDKYEQAVALMLSVALDEAISYQERIPAISLHLIIQGQASRVLQHLAASMFEHGGYSTPEDGPEFFVPPPTGAGHVVMDSRTNDVQRRPRVKDEGALTTALIEGARRAQEQKDALVMSLYVGESKMVCDPGNTAPTEGEVSHQVEPDGTIITRKFTNAAMPAGATVTHKWDK